VTGTPHRPAPSTGERQLRLLPGSLADTVAPSNPPALTPGLARALARLVQGAATRTEVCPKDDLSSKAS